MDHAYTRTDMLMADLVWLDLCDLPSCCTALSALQGNSTVRWTRRRRLLTRRSACSEIPAINNTTFQNDYETLALNLNTVSMHVCNTT